MSEQKSTPVPAELIIPILIRDIQNNLKPVAEIHKFFGVKFHKVKVYGVITDIRIKSNYIKIVLDDTTGRIGAFIDSSNNYKVQLETQPIPELFRKVKTKANFTKDPRSFLGSRATISGKPRKSFYSDEYFLSGAEIAIDDGPDRKNEIEFRKILVDFYTKNLKSD